MNPSRRCFLQLTAGAAALPVVSRVAAAQAFPARPVRIMVGTATGSAPDIVARLMGQWLSERLGQPFVIENRTGGSTNIATEVVVRSVPDGHTLLLVSPANAINATLYDKLNFNFIRDIRPVASILRSHEVLVVHPSVPAQTVPELISYAKANPGKLNLASPGNGSGPHMSGELLTGIDMVHVPYRGGGPAMTDLIGGQVQVTFTAPVVAIEHIRTGKVRVLAVTAATRSHLLPDVPTVAEFVSGYETGGWWGIGAPKDTPDAIVAKLNGEINLILADSKTKTRFAEMGGMAFAGSAAEFGNHIAAETERLGKVVKFSGMKAE